MYHLLDRREILFIGDVRRNINQQTTKTAIQILLECVLEKSNQNQTELNILPVVHSHSPF